MTFLRPSMVRTLPSTSAFLITKQRSENLTCSFKHVRQLACRFSTETPDGRSASEEVEDDTKRSVAAATGDFFLGLVALVRKSKSISSTISEISKKSRISRILPTFNEIVGVEEKREEEIASVTKDDIDPDVLWEQRRKDVEAERERRLITSPGFSFSAAGFLLPYHLGAAQCLIDKGYIRENTPLAGSSAGAIVSAVIASGVDLSACLDVSKELAEDCRRNGTVFRVGELLKESLEKFLPDDIHVRATGRIRVAITQVFRSPRALLVDQFDSKEDLINALFTSSFIPGYLAPRPVTVFRNRICVDGGLTLFMPPTVADNTIRICAFPLSRLGLQGIGISPDCNPENRPSPRKVLCLQHR
eukprot:TRINITY_DN1084_c0_g1_i4.p1 TRINITY_DN1084_c0_g1~~TRINITY_DN1084_c0_g1_i4.p1  ORF type:complete len:360 (+),score=49.23 TRINITY_DN1084_c0_g1_i4:251-1330(+)